MAACKESVTDATEGPKEEREKAQQQEKLAKARAKFTDLRVSSLNNLAKVWRDRAKRTPSGLTLIWNNGGRIYACTMGVLQIACECHRR